MANCKNCNNINSEICNLCNLNPNYTNKFKPKELKDGECQCMYCKKIFTDKIFRLKDNPKAGVCFDCY